MPAGRPTKFNKERCDKILELVRNGNFKTTAAQVAGVNPETLNAWIRKGNASKSGKYFEFSVALEAAEAEAEDNAVAKIQTKMNDSTIPAILDYMRRRFAHWNVTDKAEIKQEIKEDVDTIDARVNEYFAERKRRGISGSDLLRDDTDESVHTDNAETDNADSETGDTPKE